MNGGQKAKRQKAINRSCRNEEYQMRMDLEQKLSALPEEEIQLDKVENHLRRRRLRTAAEHQRRMVAGEAKYGRPERCRLMPKMLICSGYPVIRRHSLKKGFQASFLLACSMNGSTKMGHWIAIRLRSEDAMRHMSFIQSLAPQINGVS
jgi:hypothetical protein